MSFISWTWNFYHQYQIQLYVKNTKMFLKSRSPRLNNVSRLNQFYTDHWIWIVMASCVQSHIGSSTAHPLAFFTANTLGKKMKLYFNIRHNRRWQAMHIHIYKFRIGLSSKIIERPPKLFRLPVSVTLEWKVFILC